MLSGWFIGMLHVLLYTLVPRAPPPAATAASAPHAAMKRKASPGAYLV